MVDVVSSNNVIAAPGTPPGTAPGRLVHSYRHGDDLIVRLSGVLDGHVVPELVAGSSWAQDAGGRFALCAASPVVTASIADLALGAPLPLLRDVAG